MFYTIVTLIYILFVEVFVVRNVGLYFAKLNYESKENVKKNAIMFSIYMFLYLATLAVRYLVNIYTYKISISMLLDALVFFGMYVLYADFLKNDKKYWDFSFLTNIILTACTVLLFAGLSTVLILFMDDINILVQSSQTIYPILIALGVLLVLITPLAVYITLAIRKGKKITATEGIEGAGEVVTATPSSRKLTKEDLLRQQIRERLIKEREEEKLKEQLANGEITEEEFNAKKEEETKKEQEVIKAKQARCFNLTGKIIMGVFVIGMLVANMLLANVAKKEFFKTDDISVETVQDALTQNEYTIKETGNEKFDFLVEKKLDYINESSMVVEKAGEQVTIYFGSLKKDDTETTEINENAEGLKIISPFYDNYYTVPEPSMKTQRILGYGKYININEGKYYYTILLGDDFLFVEASSVEMGYTVLETIK